MTPEDQRASFEVAVEREIPYPEGRYDGRGIVICAGGARLFTCAWVAIGILRRTLRCSLPIQVWHLGPEEMGPPMRALLEGLDVEVVDAHAVAQRHPVRRLGGWELKPYAIIHAPYREVMLIDADNVPAVDPTVLFDWTEYAATGALFWPDVVRLKRDNPIWDLTGVAYKDGASFESGQIVIDKRRCWRALQLTLFMNEHSDLYYRHLYGDKDTFLIAWSRLGQAYAITPHAPAFLTEALYQKDFQGRVVFQHRTNAKWVYGGKNPSLSGFQHEEACLGLLAELQQIWDGRVFHPGRGDLESDRITAAMQAIRCFDYLRVGERSRRIELLTGCRVGEGRGDDAFYWWVGEDEEGPHLVLEGRRRTECRLRRQADGSWLGRSLGPGATEIQLQSPGGERTARPSAVQDEFTASSRRLLAALLQAAEERRDDASSLRDLAGALRLLAKVEPGFVASMAERLAEPAGLDGPVQRCLAAIAAEQPTQPRGDAMARPQGGHRVGAAPQLLGENYDRLR